jgi:hypothetical protein
MGEKRSKMRQKALYTEAAQTQLKTNRQLNERGTGMTEAASSTQAAQHQRDNPLSGP